jgi:DNA-binding CsgD family transcriptional regulator
MVIPRPAVGLVGRAHECRRVERLLEDARVGHGGVLVVQGEPGIGKSALLEHAIASASGFQVARATGVESEMELPFAGLHQLCAPMLDRLELLPDPQREAIATAFGLAKGSPPDRFLIGLAVLSLLSDATEHSPLLCVVDDAHWLDQASAHALTFVARRLLADRVCLLFGARHLTEELTGLSQLVVEGLGPSDARLLLASVVRGPLDERVRERVIAETHGNPLALLEWPRGMSAAELAGGFGLPTLLPLAGQIEENFRRRLGELPPPTQRFLTVAAAEPTGDAVLVWRAAGLLGIAAQDASPAIEVGLVEVGRRVSFRHPTVRSAAYGAADVDDRQAAHRALAEVTDPVADADRRAWHLALATSGPDEAVAAALERSAGRAQARGGLAAAAALLERSMALTIDPAQRAQRTIAAAGAHLEAGAFESAAALLAAVEAGPLDELSRARVEILQGNAAQGWGDMSDATDAMLSAARRLEPINLRLARDTYVMALAVADQAPGVTIVQAAQAARAAPAGPGRPHDLLLDGLATAITGGPRAAAPMLREALSAFDTIQLSADEPWWWALSLPAAVRLWDYAAFYSFATRSLQVVRDLGTLRMLPWQLDAVAFAHIWSGDLDTAASLLGEEQSVIEATGHGSTSWAVAALAALRGHEAEAKSTIAAAVEQARGRGQGLTIKSLQSAQATLCNGLGHYEEALIAAETATGQPFHTPSHLALGELIEAAVRCKRPTLAVEALEGLSESTQASGTDWALGVEARSRALLSTGGAAEALYLEAIERLDRSPLRPEAARAHLLYGEWLRRENRRVDARKHLRNAYGQLSGLGIDAFAERASRELAATGETVRKRTLNTTLDLTPQETQIAQLAAQGLTNPQIGAQLFISSRTVEFHLRKVFTKLDVTSRKQLKDRVVRLSPSISPTSPGR